MLSNVRRGRWARVSAGLIMLVAIATLAGAAIAAEGHYLSFARERNLQAEVTDLLDDPESASSDYHLNMARDLDDALRTPGVQGLWMEFKWRSIEIGDGVYDWTLLDANMAVARRYGLKLIIKIADRAFDGSDPTPAYFPSEYRVWSTGNGHSGFVAKRWDPYVYERLIRIYQAIADRYDPYPGFGGIASTETAVGTLQDGDYSLAAYRNALTAITTRTQAALTNGRLFLYLNFVKGGDNPDMNEDVRVAILRDVPHDRLIVGAPDITPDVAGMPGSVSSYRVHTRKTMPALPQFCHLQHVDQGLRSINVKSNTARQAYLDQVVRIREREQQSWFSGTPAVFEFDDLRDPDGNRVETHPASVLGELWRPAELFRFGQRNFDCDYVLWHYREHPGTGEFGWADVRPVIVDNQCLHGCSGMAQAIPKAPILD